MRNGIITHLLDLPTSSKESIGKRLLNRFAASLLLRIALYLVLIIAFLEALVLAASNGYAAILYTENGPLEWSHFLFPVISSILFMHIAKQINEYSDIFRLCGLLMIVLSVRELDHFLDIYLMDGIYKVIIAAVLLCTIYFGWNHRHGLANKFHRFTTTTPFYFIACGLLFVIIFAQLLGQNVLWVAVMGDSYVRTVKEVVEETSETVGYLLLFFAALESLFLKQSVEPVH